MKRKLPTTKQRRFDGCASLCAGLCLQCKPPASSRALACGNRGDTSTLAPRSRDGSPAIASCAGVSPSEVRASRLGHSTPAQRVFRTTSPLSSWARKSTG
ncbi:hypothetical protein C8Q77DRAFT_700007 [Trametes polyzona]|nr:hypothetical protein C8Q77DRAFT_700007 [Trametes polyzona]